MSDRDDVGTRLAAALHEEADRVRPEPALHSILARTRLAPTQARRWWAPAAGALAAAALVAMALVVLTARPATEPTPASAEREVTVYFSTADGKLVPETLTVPATDNPGADAVNALLTKQPSDPDYGNPWSALDRGRLTTGPVTLQSVTEIDGVVTVDFAGPVDNPWNASPLSIYPEVPVQQLVFTVQDAVGSVAPIYITMGGSLVDEVLATQVKQPIQRDRYALAPVRIQSPMQGETVSSPVTVSGQSATFEANVVWRVKQDGEVVERGFTTSKGANGLFGPFEFTVELPPGDYTVEAYEESAENGEVINLDSKDFTVEPGGPPQPSVTPTAQRQVTVYMLQASSEPRRMAGGQLVPETVSWQDSGDTGLDAVNALLSSESTDPDYLNVWTQLSDENNSGPVELNGPVTVTSVSERDGQITVDFAGPVDNPWRALIDWVVSPGLFSQQLVWTVQDALDSEAPVLVTMDGEPVDTILGAEVKNPLQRDPYALPLSRSSTLSRARRCRAR
jgi:hypothetical protein